MHGLFIDPNQEVAVSDDDGSTIWIKQRMDFATDAAVTAESARLNRGTDRLMQRPYELALLYHNIVRWEGGLFADLPCDRKHIGRLDPLHPLVRKVLTAIDEQNVAPTEPPPDRDGAKKKATDDDTSTA